MYHDFHDDTPGKREQVEEMVRDLSVRNAVFVVIVENCAKDVDQLTDTGIKLTRRELGADDLDLQGSSWRCLQLFHLDSGNLGSTKLCNHEGRSQA